MTCDEFQAVPEEKRPGVDSQFLRLARQEGYSRCEKCSSYVELSSGCNHMTCRCGHHFCHVCNAKWKTCGCPQWYEENLEIQARNRAGPEAHIPEVRKEVRHCFSFLHFVSYLLPFTFYLLRSSNTNVVVLSQRSSVRMMESFLEFRGRYGEEATATIADLSAIIITTDAMNVQLECVTLADSIVL